MDNMDNKAVVKYDRRFPMFFTGVNTLSKIDQDLFFAVLSLIKERKSINTVISSSVLINRSKYLKRHQGKYTTAKICNLIKNMVINVSTVTVVIDAPDAFEALSLFDRFRVDKNTADLTVVLAPAFSNMFFDIADIRFTRFYLDRFIGLKSKYSKNLYRLLLDHHSSFTIDIDDFCALFGIEGNKKDKKYISAKKQLLHRLPKYVDDVKATGDFSQLEYIFNHSASLRYHPIVSITFNFIENRNRIREVNTIDNNPADDKLYCPDCHELLVCSKNRKTGVYFYRHADYKHCKCPHPTFASKDAVLEAWETKNKEQKRTAAQDKRQRERNANLQRQDTNLTKIKLPDFANLKPKSVDDVELPHMSD